MMSNYQQAMQIIKALHRAGFQALLAGGCVRDRLLGQSAKDYDVATNALPEQIIPLFGKTLKIGAQFGVVMVILQGQQVEVATFRTEAGYADGRHPDRVEFTDARQDAARRDFTINGMFYDPLKKEVLDFVGGRADLEKKIIRTIGSPDERFSEDYLRMLRAVRFAVRLDFHIEDATWQAICKYAGRIAKISAERIALELEGALAHPHRKRAAQLLIESGLAGAIFNGFAGMPADMAIRTIGHLPQVVDFALALAAFFAELPTKTALDYAKDLKLSNAFLKHLRFLLEHRGVLLDADLPLARLKILAAEPYWQDLVDLQAAIQKANADPCESVNIIQKRASRLDVRKLKPKPLLNGHQLIALGAAPGPMVGQLARELYIAQLAEQIHTSQQARQWAVRWLQKHKASSKNNLAKKTPNR